MKQQLSQIALSSSGKHFCILNKPQTRVYSTLSLNQIWTIPKQTKIASFLYDTGLIALVQLSNPCIVSIYDFKYKRHVKDVDFISTILKVQYIRNILLVATMSKIQVYDLSEQQNIVYINISHGNKCFFSKLFETLRLGYFTDNLFVSHSIWNNSKFQLQDADYEEGRYSYDGQYFVLRDKQNLKIYTNNSLINVIHTASFDKFLINPFSSCIPLIVFNFDNEIEVKTLYRLQNSVSKIIEQSTQNIGQQITNLKFMVAIDNKIHLINGQNRRIFVNKQ